MSLGKFAVDAVKAWNPLSPEAYERRDRNKAYRRARRAARRGESLTEQEYEILQTHKETPMALDLGTRTSTNGLVGGGLLGTVYVQLVGVLPYPDLVAALTTPQMVVLVSAGLTWLVTRFSKTPAVPKAL